MNPEVAEFEAQASYRPKINAAHNRLMKMAMVSITAALTLVAALSNPLTPTINPMGGKNTLAKRMTSMKLKLQSSTGDAVTLPGASTGRPHPVQTIAFSFTAFPQ